MAGRGRGRGRSNLSFNVEELGFGRGEALPSSVLQPPPLFPPLSMKPAILTSGDKYDYLAALKQEFRSTAMESPFYLKVDTKRRDVKRYSDKYQQATNSDCDIQFNPDWRYMPAELQPKVKSTRSAKPNLKVKKAKNLSDITTALNELEAKEGKGDNAEEEEEENKEEEEEQEEEIVYEEEDEEEETDYLQSYFDNGENYLDEEDDNLDDEATY